MGTGSLCRGLWAKGIREGSEMEDLTVHGTSGLFLEGFLPSSRDWGPGLQEGDTKDPVHGQRDSGKGVE